MTAGLAEAEVEGRTGEQDNLWSEYQADERLEEKSHADFRLVSKKESSFSFHDGKGIILLLPIRHQGTRLLLS